MKTIGVLIADVHEYNPFCKWATENGAKTFTENGMNMLEGELFGVKLIAMMTNIGKVNAAIAATNLILKYGECFCYVFASPFAEGIVFVYVCDKYAYCFHFMSSFSLSIYALAA